MFDDLKDNSNNNQADLAATSQAPSDLPSVPSAPSAPAEPKSMVVEDMLSDEDSAPSPLGNQDMPPQAKTQMSGQTPEPIKLTQDTDKPAAFKPIGASAVNPATASPEPMPELEGVKNDVPSMPEDPMAWSGGHADNTATKKKMLGIGITVVALALIGIGGYVVYSQFFASSDNIEILPNEFDATNDQTQSTTDDQVDNTNTNNTNLPANDNNDGFTTQDNQNNEENILPIDSDGDGLTDVEEAEYNTDPNLADTDRDGLFDREEIVSWKTDPLNPDSDGDSYLDGDEVENGYDPLGPGTLDYFDQLNF